MDETYEFSAVWDGRGHGLSFPAIWDAIRAATRNPAKVLEIGSFEGFSTCKMIELFAAHNPVAVTCIDSWDGAIAFDGRVGPSNEELFRRNVSLAMRQAAHEVTLRVIKSESYLGLSSLVADGESETFDWIYVDGSHEAPDVLSDAVAAFKLLRRGGVMVLDDYLWRDALIKGGHINNTPKPAIDAFVNIHYDRLSVFRGAGLFQLYIRKH